MPRSASLGIAHERPGSPIVSPAAIRAVELPNTNVNAISAVSNFFISYFFLYPVGHLGFTAVTFFVALPLTQVMEVSSLQLALLQMAELTSRELLGMRM